MEAISCVMRPADKLSCSFPVDLCSACYWNNCSGLIFSLTSLFLNLHPLWEVKKIRNWPEGEKQQELAPCAEFDIVDCQIPGELLFSLGKLQRRPLCPSSNKHSAHFLSVSFTASSFLSCSENVVLFRLFYTLLILTGINPDSHHLFVWVQALTWSFIYTTPICSQLLQERHEPR